MHWNFLHPQFCVCPSGQEPHELVELKVHGADMAFLSWAAVSHTETPGTLLQSERNGGGGVTHAAPTLPPPFHPDI